MKDEEKDVLKSVSKRTLIKMKEDVTSVEKKHLVRPIVLLAMVLAAFAVVKSPMLLLLGACIFIAAAAVSANSKSDLIALKDALLKKGDVNKKSKKKS